MTPKLFLKALFLLMLIGAYFYLRPSVTSNLNEGIKEVGKACLAGDFSMKYAEVENKEIINILRENKLTTTFVAFDEIRKRYLQPDNCDMLNEKKLILISLYDTLIEYNASPIDPFRVDYCLRLVGIGEKKFWMLNSSFWRYSNPCKLD